MLAACLHRFFFVPRSFLVALCALAFEKWVQLVVGLGAVEFVHEWFFQYLLKIVVLPHHKKRWPHPLVRPWPFDQFDGHNFLGHLADHSLLHE